MAEQKWKSWGTRQLTGRPHVHHGYVGRERIERTCGHDHRKRQRAADCADRLARQLNRAHLGL